MNKTDLINLLKFTELTNLFAITLRKTILNKDGSAENNAQHSFQMAMISWYLNDTMKLKLNTKRLMLYSLVHDLVKTYTGTYAAYKRDSQNQIEKDSAEENALKKIKKDFKEFRGLVIAMNKYNKRNDKESKFIYALDKLIPIINIELNNNDFYFQSKTTFSQMLEVKEEKIKKDPVIYEYFKLLKKYLIEDTKFFWPENQDRNYSNKYYSFKTDN